MHKRWLIFRAFQFWQFWHKMIKKARFRALKVKPHRNSSKCLSQFFHWDNKPTEKYNLKKYSKKKFCFTSCSRLRRISLSVAFFFQGCPWLVVSFWYSLQILLSCLLLLLYSISLLSVISCSAKFSSFWDASLKIGVCCYVQPNLCYGFISNFWSLFGNLLVTLWSPFGHFFVTFCHFLAPVWSLIGHFWGNFWSIFWLKP